MKVSAAWLNEYMSHNLSAQEMGERLVKAGIELEQIISSVKIDRGVVVGLVTKVTQHPNADRLRLADVQISKDTTLHVVCGAPNLAEGQKVALARPGTVMPDGLEIKKSEIRGQSSNGMICSGKELGVSDDHEGIMVLPHDYPLGKTLCDIWDSGEILDVTTAANRSDLQSVLGLAREIQAQAPGNLKEPVGTGKLTTKADSSLVSKVDNEKVPRYMLARLKIEQVGKSPLWMQDRLVASGVRPINTVVDVTNYVMLEYGQPLHAFDANQVKLPVSARLARDEKLTTLDGTQRKLTKEDLVIADADGPIGIAGVMGGNSSEIRESTREILLEAAVFDGSLIRKTAKRNGLRTESSARFERGLPVELPPLALSRAIQLLNELCGASKPEFVVDVINTQPKRREVKLSAPHVENLLGMPVSNKLIVQKLERLGFSIQGTADGFKIEVPWWRVDVKIAEDLIEEVGRSIGYDQLTPTLPVWRPSGIDFDTRWAKRWNLKAAMRSLGLFEVVTYSFVSQQLLTDFGYDLKRHLRLKNPLSSEQAYLRSTLMPSLVANTAKNARYSKDFGLVEVSKVYKAGAHHKQLPAEPYHLAVSRRGGYRHVKAALDLIGTVFGLEIEVLPKPQLGMHPKRSAEVVLGREVIGWIGEIHPEITAKYKISGELGYLELNLEAIFEHKGNFKPDAVSKYPSISRDLAIVVPTETLWKQAKHIIAGLNICKASFLNDYYGEDLPKGTKSMAIRLTFSSMDRTLTDDEADAGVAKVMAELAKTLGAKERT